MYHRAGVKVVAFLSSEIEAKVIANNWHHLNKFLSQESRSMAEATLTSVFACLLYFLMLQVLAHNILSLGWRKGKRP
jgi:hypothetical protein